ncbi:MAG TPA: DMT family transporter [Terriglobales bacterium]|nr:DMT family transporter [Terriglobales bacterium]
MPANLPPKSARVRVWVADLSLAAVTLIWGVTFPVVQGALAGASPLTFNAVRMTLAGALLALLYRPRWRRLSRVTWWVGALLGFLLATGYGFQTTGLALTSASVSAFLTSMSVVLVPLLLALGWRRRIETCAWLGAGVAAVGIYLLVVAGRHSGAAASSLAGRGDALTLLCAVAFALHIITLGEWAPKLGYRDLAVMQIVFAAVFTWLFLPVVEVPRWHSSPRLWLALAVTSVLATAVAFSVQSWAQQFTPSTHTAVVFALEPVFAWMAAAWGWHQHLEPVQVAGALLILAAMAVVEIGKAGVNGTRGNAGTAGGL